MPAFVGREVSLDIGDKRRLFRVTAVDSTGRVSGADVRLTDPELIEVLGPWDDIRNWGRMSQLDAKIIADDIEDWRACNQCKACMAEPDDDGVIRHGKGCFVEDEDGGGEGYAEPPAFLRH